MSGEQHHARRFLRTAQDELLNLDHVVRLKAAGGIVMAVMDDGTVVELHRTVRFDDVVAVLATGWVDG